MAKTIVIFSTKGGVGKTFVAANLAVSLAKDENKRVCLVDLNLQVVGDMARMLSLNPQTAMVDLLDALGKQPKEFKKDDFLTRLSRLSSSRRAGARGLNRAPWFRRYCLVRGSVDI